MDATDTERLATPYSSADLVDDKGRAHAAIAWTVPNDSGSGVVDRWQVYRLCKGEDNGQVLDSGCVDGRERAMGEAKDAAARLGLVSVRPI
jgi:hypothetical protein